MSIRAINWAIDVCKRIGAPSRHRHVLLIIASHHHDKTGACFPAYDTIAEGCGVSRRSVMRFVAELEENGLLVVQKRRKNGHQGSNQFMLFGRPAGKKWLETRVTKKAPCESDSSVTLPRVTPVSPDRDWYNRGDDNAPANVLDFPSQKVANGGSDV